MIEITRRSNKNSWIAVEDVKLVKLVEEFGANNWTLIAEMMGGKRSKQCRERYHNHLQANIKKGSWTKEEEQLIIELQQKYGNQWSKIASHFQGRTDNSIKNRFNSMMRSMHHKLAKLENQKNKLEKAAMISKQVAGMFSSSAVASTSVHINTGDSRLLKVGQMISSSSIDSSKEDSVASSSPPLKRRHPLVPTLPLDLMQRKASPVHSSLKESVSIIVTPFSLEPSTIAIEPSSVITVCLNNTSNNQGPESLSIETETFRSSSSIEMLQMLLNDTDYSSPSTPSSSLPSPDLRSGDGNDGITDFDSTTATSLYKYLYHIDDDAIGYQSQFQYGSKDYQQSSLLYVCTATACDSRYDRNECTVNNSNNNYNSYNSLNDMNQFCTSNASTAPCFWEEIKSYSATIDGSLVPLVPVPILSQVTSIPASVSPRADQISVESECSNLHRLPNSLWTMKRQRSGTPCF